MAAISDIEEESKKGDPLVSVIVPSYNHQNYVRETIESVWAQSYKNIELIVVDDGSKDDSSKIIEELLGDSPISMKFIRLANGGIVRALNEGLRVARGDFVGVLASDDRYDKDKIKNHIDQMISDEEIVLGHSDVSIIDEFGNRSVLDISARGVSAHGVVGLEVLLGRAFIRFSPVVRMDALRAIGGFDERYKIEDWPLYLKMAHVGKIGYINKKLTERRVHSHNWSSALARQVDVNFSNAALDLIREYSPSDEIYEVAAVSHMIPHLKGAIFQGNFRGGVTLAREIVRRFPAKKWIVFGAFFGGVLSHFYAKNVKPFTPPLVQKFIISVRDFGRRG